MRVLRLEVSVYKVYITNHAVLNHFFSRGVGGGGDLTVNSKEEKDLGPNYVKEFGLCTPLSPFSTKEMVFPYSISRF